MGRPPDGGTARRYDTTRVEVKRNVGDRVGHRVGLNPPPSPAPTPITEWAHPERREGGGACRIRKGMIVCCTPVHAQQEAARSTSLPVEVVDGRLRRSCQAGLGGRGC